MRLIFATFKIDSATQKLLNLIRNMPLISVKGCTVDVHASLESLESTLKRPTPGKELMIFVASRQSDLERLTGIHPLFENTPLILILPKNTKGTLALAHRLYPRFIGYKKSDFVDVMMVLENITAKMMPEYLPNDKKEVACSNTSAWE